MSSYSKVDLSSLDIDWFGVDTSGKLAQFASSTTGLVPKSVVNRKMENEKKIVPIEGFKRMLRLIIYYI